MTYLDRAALLAAFLDLAEDDFSDPALPAPVRIRELTAQQVHEVRQSAGGGEAFDSALFNAMVIASGAIDAETRQPLFTRMDAMQLAQGRHLLAARLSGAIWALSEATPEAFRRRRAAADGAGDDGAGGGGEPAGPEAAENVA